jgi:predicted alpha-1,6-mannanase (GH76 family)
MVLLVLCLVSGGGETSGQSYLSPAQQEHARRVREVARVLGTTYDYETGLFRGTGWWNSANGITALANVSRDLQTKEFDAIFTNTFKVSQRKYPGFLNKFYDDEGWWALAWLDVYELRKDRRYLIMAKSIFTDMTGGWSDTCGGGIWWKKNEHYKNAIANELFLSVAVRLALLTRNKTRAGYLEWAEKEKRWLLASGMINHDFLINDGLDTSCRNNHQDSWSYNQGVILTGLAGFYKLTGDITALQFANRIADAASQNLTDEQGIIHDPCEPTCGADGVEFKGILVRNLVTLIAASTSSTASKLIQVNAESVWTRARTESDHFSLNWSGPPQDSGTGSLISALDAITAGLSIRMKGPIPRVDQER